MFADRWQSVITDHAAVGLQVALIALAIVITIHILLRKTDPKASLMWIALVWFAPFFGAVFYILFGINRIRSRARRLVALPDNPGLENTVETENIIKNHWNEFEILTDRVTKSERHSGNDIKILEGVETAHQAMIGAINQAKHTILLSTYIFRNDDLGNGLADALIIADKRGVDVRVLLDGVGSGFFRSRIFRRLKKGGVESRRFLHSIWPWRMPYLNLRNHRKLLLIDGRTAFTGSLNIGRVLNLETHFKITGPVLTDFMAAFEQDWLLSGGGSLPQLFALITQDKSGQVAARGILSGPIYSRERLRWVLLGAMGAATRQIRIVSPYFIPDRGLLSGLLLAVLRGVRVEIILPKHSNYAFADWASHRQILELLRSGCSIYYRSDVFDHSKITTIDGQWALIGSSNWDARSLRLNFEFDLECESPVFCKEIDEIIDARIAASERLSWESYNERSQLAKIRDSAARLLLPYL